ncbi:MAG: hypothetical protein HYR72_14460 [Deltaproteobacteria bacterium]|nr:hypothetical protein [Deltaproteobacteria bacterium]MBI3391547.1 hypothetical protein [Deltaproteobacteria bacterium]
MQLNAARTRWLLIAMLAFNLLSSFVSAFLLATKPSWFEVARVKSLALGDFLFPIAAMICIPLVARGIAAARNTFARAFWIAFAAQLALVLVSPVLRAHLSAIIESTLDLLESVALATVFGVLLWNHVIAPFEIRVPGSKHRAA